MWKHKKSHLIIILLLIHLAGCASTTFIPPGIAGWPNNKLARLTDLPSDWGSSYPLSSIDGIPIPQSMFSKTTLYIKPGQHEVTYYYRHYKPRWVNVGEVLDHRSTGIHSYEVTKVTHAGYIPAHEYIEDKCLLTFVAGKTYSPIDVKELLIKAGCKNPDITHRDKR